jgi:hypothetical protein
MLPSNLLQAEHTAGLVHKLLIKTKDADIRGEVRRHITRFM